MLTAIVEIPLVASNAYVTRATIELVRLVKTSMSVVRFFITAMKKQLVSILHPVSTVPVTKDFDLTNVRTLQSLGN